MKQESFSDMEYSCRKKKMKAGRRHCGRHVDQRTQLHQECREEAGPRNAPNKKGKSVAFRHEVPHRRGRGQVHTVEATAANVHDVTMAAKLLREDDEVVYGDSAYLGLEKRDEIKQNTLLSAIEYRINRRPGRLPKVSRPHKKTV